MAVLLITYDLNRPGQNYTDLLDKIKSYGSWARLSESSYAVATQNTPQTVYSQLSPHLDNSDTLYIVTLKRPYSGQGPQDVNNWLEANLPY